MAVDKKMNILIVDDHQTMRRTIADILKQFGFKSHHFAENGKAAWEKIKVIPIDLVILDWNMPVMNGLELLQTVRKSQLHGEIPILMVTAEAEQTNVMEAIDAGVTNYVVKPFTPRTLMQKLEQIFGEKLMPEEEKKAGKPSVFVSKGNTKKPLSR